VERALTSSHSVHFYDSSTPMTTTEWPDRANSASPSSVLPQSGGVIILVDPASTGALLALHLANQGRELVRVWSDMCPDTIRNHSKAGCEVAYRATYDYMPSSALYLARELAEKHGPAESLTVLVGCETGVDAADVLAAALNDSRGNGVSEVRRNKFLQGEAVRSAGLDAPMQALVSTADEVEDFLSTRSFPTPFKAVVKPVDGAGSDGVAICNSQDGVRKAFGSLVGTHNVLGLACKTVLLQEYLKGQEYVVDTVSRDGMHKCVAIWRYDKREANGAPVVLYGMHPLGITDEPALEGMLAYVQGALDALGIRYGAMHTEVKLEERGPVLVEVNCRLHGAEGVWLPVSEACYGYTQISAMVDAYFEPKRFELLPPAPMPTKRGAWVTIRSSASGFIRTIEHERLAQLRALPSYLEEYLSPALVVGGHVAMTIDVCKIYGCFNLSHADPAQLAADYDKAQQLVEDGLFSLVEATAGDDVNAVVQTC